MVWTFNLKPKHISLALRCIRFLFLLVPTYMYLYVNEYGIRAMFHQMLCSLSLWLYCTGTRTHLIPFSLYVSPLASTILSLGFCGGYCFIIGCRLLFFFPSEHRGRACPSVCLSTKNIHTIIINFRGQFSNVGL